MAPLCIQSQRPWRNGWQFVCCTGVPVEARMCAKTRPERTCAASSRRLRSFQAGSMLWNGRASSPSPYQPTPKPSPFVVSAPSVRVQALVDERVLRLVEQLLEEHRRSRVGEPAAHASARRPLPALVVVDGLGWRWRRGSWRSMSARSMSAMSWVKPRRTTTRSAARSVRFSGKVYAGTCQPRSRSAFETSKTV